jgi:hypothetical protein
VLSQQHRGCGPPIRTLLCVADLITTGQLWRVGRRGAHDQRVADDLGPGEPPEAFPAVAVAEYPLVVPGLVEHAEVAGDHPRFDMFG